MTLRKTLWYIVHNYITSPDGYIFIQFLIPPPLYYPQILECINYEMLMRRAIRFKSIRNNFQNAFNTFTKEAK